MKAAAAGLALLVAACVAPCPPPETVTQCEAWIPQQVPMATQHGIATMTILVCAHWSTQTNPRTADWAHHKGALP